LTAFFSVAKVDMTVKMVVPTLGKRLTREGVVTALIAGLVLKMLATEYRFAPVCPARFYNS
jgi:hypothetical protein